MVTDSLPFAAAIARIDAAHDEDPSREVCDGVPLPRELVYARRMSAWLERLEPNASDALRLAVRAQHIRRWTVPRNSYPMDRAGYHRWRDALARMHAETAGAMVREAGYDEQTATRVQALVRKERLKLDLETQVLEDVACLVFLENQFAEFSGKHDPQEVVRIVRRTWAKMSPRARDAALALPLPPAARQLVAQALEQTP